MTSRMYSRITLGMQGREVGLVNSSPSTSTIKQDIWSMLEDFKSDILHMFSLQMDTMQIKRRQEEVEMALAIFFPR